MHACRYGHWEVVQTLLLFRSNVSHLWSKSQCIVCGSSVVEGIIGVGILFYIANAAFPFQVTRADYLSGKTALHFAAFNGHVRCIRLVVADIVPSAPYETITSMSDGDKNSSSLRYVYDQSYRNAVVLLF